MEITNEEQMIMQIIMNSANAKGLIYEAMSLSKEEDFEGARKKLVEANDAINDAHTSQTAWLTAEARGESNGISALLVHAQDHLMTTMSEMNMITEMIALREEMSQIKRGVH